MIKRKSPTVILRDLVEKHGLAKTRFVLVVGLLALMMSDREKPTGKERCVFKSVKKRMFADLKRLDKMEASK